jgi:biotin transport system permease protein
MLLALSTAPLFLGPPALVPIGLLLAAGAVSAGIRPWELLRGSRPLGIVVLLAALVRSFDLRPRGPFPLVFNKPGFIEALLFTGTIILSFSAGALLFSVTTMTELRDSLERAETILLRPLALFLGVCRASRVKSQKIADQAIFYPANSESTPDNRDFCVTGDTKIHKCKRPPERPRLSLGISLMLGFLPRFFEIWEEAKDAYTARAGKGGVSQLVVLIPLVTERMMEKAAETAGILEARGLIFQVQAPGDTSYRQAVYTKHTDISNYKK